MEKGIRKICAAGHSFYKKSDCPVCPRCEKIKAENLSPFSILSAPARRALNNNGIHSLEQLNKFTEEKILSFHGFGPAAIPLIRTAMKDAGLEPMKKCHDLF